jgi:predicted RNA-binding Zn-ribbon protein involved in translation (DUF1610 family)
MSTSLASYLKSLESQPGYRTLTIAEVAGALTTIIINDGKPESSVKRGKRVAFQCKGCGKTMKIRKEYLNKHGQTIRYRECNGCVSSEHTIEIAVKVYERLVEGKRVRVDVGVGGEGEGGV